jgi:hypothetical protein
MKSKIKILSLLLLTGNLVLNAQQTIPTNGLYAHYTFNGNTLDYTANALHGVPSGGSTNAIYSTDRFNNPQACYEVNMSNNKIVLPADNLIFGDYSVSAWIKIKSVQPYARLYDFGNGYTSDNVIGKLSHAGAGTPSIEHYNGNNQSAAYHVSSTIVSNSSWHHLVYISEGFRLKIYLDTVLIAMHTGTVMPVSVMRNSNFLGGSQLPWDASDIFMDDFRLYNRALQAEEIVALFNETNSLTVGLNHEKAKVSAPVIFPNPCHGKMYIRDVNWSEGTEMTIFDLKGTIVKKQSFTTGISGQVLEVDLNGLENGVYFVETTVSGVSQRTKLIKLE